ncbi:MAG: NYN domain-containing protein [Oscillospiraceae bacterium]|nr:NYN domain-containing protein [Oscillospiraceae bacterium]
MTTDITESVALVAYMIGVKKHILKEHMDPAKLELAENSRSATVIRYLCKLRTALMQKFKKTDDEMRFNLKNINSIEWFDHENIKKLEEWGISVVKSNTRSEEYMQEFTRLINENIDKCRDLFYDWVDWDYLKELFVVPKYTKPNVMRQEHDKYQKYRSFYPFQMYIYWDQPYDAGNILLSDKKFFKFLYALHNDFIEDSSKYRDAHEETKTTIYSFIEDADRIAIAVDCENSDAYKLYGVLKNLNQDELAKIEKIVLYDDYHTGSGWDSLEKFVKIPIEHIEVDRVTDGKSLVDIKMTAGVTKDFYKNDITSFILCSSDSDYWGLISSLPEADFLVMYEYSKCGQAIKDALETRDIYYCAMDDFCTGNTDEFKRAVLFAAMEKYLPHLLSMNAKELLEKVYTDTRITASEKEMEIFYNRYIKTIRLRINAEGNFTAEIDR